MQAGPHISPPRVARLSRCASLLCSERRGAGGAVDSLFTTASREAAPDNQWLKAAAHAAAAICRPSGAVFRRSSVGVQKVGDQILGVGAVEIRPGDRIRALVGPVDLGAE